MLGIDVSLILQLVGIVLWLVFLEGLLSADNALVLAVMVRHLPKFEQKRALRYGIWGAFVFRLIAVVLSSFLLAFWHFKVVGGLYLLYLAIAHFASGQDESDAPSHARFGSSFWGTVISVELADIAFSIDSIVAAFALAPNHLGQVVRLGTVYLGGVLGIIAMRFVAGYFLILLERFKGLAAGAYYLVAWIGLKLMIDGFHDGKWIPWEMSDWVFWPGMILIVIASLVYQPREKKTAPQEVPVEVGRTEETPAVDQLGTQHSE